MRRLRQTNLGDRWNHLAPLQAGADHLVLGGLSDGDPFQRHLCPATAAPARLGLVPQRLAALRQAAPQHDRSLPGPARWPRRAPVRARFRYKLKRSVFTSIGRAPDGHRQWLRGQDHNKLSRTLDQIPDLILAVVEREEKR